MYYCPVRALCKVISDTPTISQTDPLLMFYENRAPVPSLFVVKKLGHADLVCKISLQSWEERCNKRLYMDGCSGLPIKNLGGWSLDAYQTYIRTENCRVTVINLIRREVLKYE